MPDKTDHEITEAMAKAIEATMFAPYELPLDAELHAKYLDTTRAALAVADPLILARHAAALREARETALREALAAILKVRRERGRGKGAWDNGVHDAGIMCRDAILALLNQPPETSI